MESPKISFFDNDGQNIVRSIPKDFSRIYGKLKHNFLSQNKRSESMNEIHPENR